MLFFDRKTGLYATIGLLTLSLSSLVLFLWQGVALFLRDAGQSSDVVGLLFLAGIPWILRFIWAPLVDRKGFKSLGHFRSWILGTQLMIVFGVLLLATTNPANSPHAIVAILAVLSIFMGTQQTAIFGLMATQLGPQDRVSGMTVQAVAYASASVLMGLGVLYVLADLGWRPTVLVIAIGSGVFFFVIAPFKLDAGRKPSEKKPSFVSQFKILKDRRVQRLLIATLFINVTIASTYGLQSLMLIDAGLSVSDAGLVAIVGSGAVGFIGGYLAKPVTERYGGYLVLSAIGIALAISCIGYGFALRSGLTAWLVIGLILTNSFFLFALMPSTKSILLGYCGEGREATDFASYSGVEGLFFMVTTSILASQVDSLGYPSILIFAGLFAAVGSVFAWRIRMDGKIEQEEVVV